MNCVLLFFHLYLHHFVFVVVFTYRAADNPKDQLCSMFTNVYTGYYSPSEEAFTVIPVVSKKLL